MKIIASLLVFTLCVAIGFSTYWLGGGNFDRSENLSFTFLLSVLFGLCLSGFVFSAWEQLKK